MEQCALLFGFTVVSMSNLGIPDDLHEGLLVAYVLAVTSVCVLLLLAAVICTFLLLAVTRYAARSLEEDVKQLDVAQLEIESPFSTWWLKRCEQEQMGAYKFMVIGVVLFFVYLAILSWIQFEHSVLTSSSISVLCLMGLLTWQLRIASRWRYLLQPPNVTTSRPFSTSLLVPPASPSTPLSKRKSSIAGSLPVIPSPSTRLSSAQPYVSYK
ncbi:hypothetical protein P43SY_007959 [Pythium insidiosum]|uniref:Uncharacterized protein n=1 Tax=Pythium insidiosum TaxID=114742 RepID=A0AAD5L7S0_PYTIN|nr:hypothetical protein P43SY_007959 [Pythium insidiosum]